MINPGSIFPAARTLGTTNLGSTIVQSRSKENAPLMSSSTISLDSLDIGDELRSAPTVFSKSRLMSTSVGRRARNVFKNNVGLLYVVASQVFFSVMNVAVKSLNNLDPPVPAIEVRYPWILCLILHNAYYAISVDHCANGELTAKTITILFSVCGLFRLSLIFVVSYTCMLVI